MAGDQERIVGTQCRKPTSRIDPLEIEAVEVHQSKDSRTEWNVDEFPGSKKSKPSELNHGNIAPSVEDRGVTMSYALQTTTVTLAGLRRLWFPGRDDAETAERTMAARMVLASLALCAITQLDKAGGLSLRSRCDLCPETPSDAFDVVSNDGSVETVPITSDDASLLLADAVGRAGRPACLGTRSRKRWSRRSGS